MTDSKVLQQVAVLHYGTDNPDSQARLFAEGFQSQGCEVDLLNRREDWLRPYDMVLGFGPESLRASMLPALDRLLAMPVNQRPFLYWWYTEGIPNPRLPIWLAKALAGVRIGADRLMMRSSTAQRLLRALRLAQPGFRYRIIGEVLAFQSHRVLDGLAVTSHARAAYLRRLGLTPIVAPYGYAPAFNGYHMALHRDVDVTFFGAVGKGRRARLLQRVTAELQQRGISVAVQTNLYGVPLWEFLNRTKVVLNIFRQPYDFFGLRFTTCAANKALFVSEPVIDNEPFVPGQHLVAAPVERLADTIAYYLSNEHEREAMTDTAYRLVTQEYTIHNMAGRVLDDARRLQQ